jgi:hypothetical protein
MKTLTGCGLQSILLLIIACLLAVPLACLAALTAPLHSPGYASSFLCPAGSQLESEWYQATYNKPGERSLSVACVDDAGNTVPANSLDGATLFDGILRYFPVCFIPIIVAGVVILLLLNGLLRWMRERRRTGPAHS